ELMPWWCEGQAGIALALLKAYEVLGDERCRQYAEMTLQSYKPALLVSNLSQCHGLAGLGEIYLEAFRILQDEIWLQRATWITNVILHLKNEHSKYGPYWIVESERKPVADFMIGNTGILHYLLRHCKSGEGARHYADLI